MYYKYPCPLCAQIHPLQFHSFPWRSWFDANGERVWIQVPVIKCFESRRRGTQHTKRLLPDFLIPYSPVRLDRVIEAEEKRREEGASLEACCSIMGCLELRTVRKHLNRLHEAAVSAYLQLSEQLAYTPQYARLPEPDPGQSAVMRLNTIQHISFQAAGLSGRPATGLWQNLQEQWWHLVGKQSTSCVSQIVRPP